MLAQRTLSLAESLASLPEAQRNEILSDLSERQAEELAFDWSFWGRPEQLEPPGNWSIWLILAGRGWGKTRCGAEWVRKIACGKTPLSAGEVGRIALVAETAADARDVIVEGESGILAIHPNDFRPLYEPSKRRLTWPNGTVATLYNAVEPDQLRGPQHEAAWCDELAKWRYARETWDNLEFGLRLGTNPRTVITTTPRPIPLLREILGEGGVHPTKGSTYDNRANLSPKFLARIEGRYAGTRLGRQELDAELLDDAPGALWSRANLDAHRRKKSEVPQLQRVVVAIDPAAVAGGGGDTDRGAKTGIVAAGLGIDGRGYVLDDVSCALGPHGWASRAVAAFDEHKADIIVAEINQGGDMVEATVRSVRDIIPFKKVHASRGKVTRAEPVAALYEQGRVSHVGSFSDLEDNMVLFTPLGIEGDTTADNVDALVWALTELFPNIIHWKPDDPSERKAAARNDYKPAYSRDSDDGVLTI